jgi:D-serine deaminase-like pyridoxal phosphate-dependent protein
MSSIRERDRNVGRKLQDVEGPAVALDLAVIKINCQDMLNQCRDLGFDFRAHIKTHKVSKSKPRGGICCNGQCYTE